MKEVLIICAAGMSSSLIAKKATEYFEANNIAITVDAINASAGVETIQKNTFDMYLCSPQTKMFYQKLKAAADTVGKPLENIPPQAYIPIPMGTEKLAKLITDVIGE
ncbi:MAG: PTS cellobiose transporter subunit IIB [Turicibacter sp.]|nr:PTS cellobiose transporter subunit IIB [Turicibacter sp.]